MAVDLQNKPKKMSSLTLSADQILSMTDLELLQELPFREKSLMRPAMDGDLNKLAERLQARLRKPSKSFERLQQKQPVANPFPSALFRSSKRLASTFETIISSTTEAIHNEIESDALAKLSQLLDAIVIVGPKLSPEQFWQLWRLAVVVLSTDQFAGPAQFDLKQLPLLAELQFKAGLLFDGLKGAGRTATTGRQRLCEDLLESTDTDGTPHAEKVEHLTAWISLQARCLFWSRAYGMNLWSDEAVDRYQELLRIIGPLCTRRGALIAQAEEPEPVRPLLYLLAQWSGWSRKSPLARLLGADNDPHRLNGQSNKSQSNKKNRIKTKALPGTQSDWAHVAALRNGWAPEDDTLLVTHHCVLPQLHLSARGSKVITGTWDLQLVIDDLHVPLDDDGWSCVAWHSDPDADYLELQMVLSDGVRIERQVLLPRGEHSLLLADSVSAPAGAKIDYASSLPFSVAVAATPDQYTREVQLKTKTQTLRAFPLTLEQDRVNSTPGDLTFEHQRLTLKQQGRSALYASLVLDWEPKRKAKQADWRVLTISEQQQMIPPHVAAAQRLRVGKSQLFNYRSLVESDNARCALGHHTFHETVIGRFNTEGEIEPYVLVE